MTKDEFLSCCSKLESDTKTKILSYLKSFDEPSAYSSAYVTDVVTNEKFDKSDNAYTDGIYTWYDSWIYHFEKYDMKLNDDFIQYVLEQTK